MKKRSVKFLGILMSVIMMAGTILPVYADEIPEDVETKESVEDAADEDESISVQAEEGNEEEPDITDEANVSEDSEDTDIISEEPAAAEEPDTFDETETTDSESEDSVSIEETDAVEPAEEEMILEEQASDTTWQNDWDYYLDESDWVWDPASGKSYPARREIRIYQYNGSNRVYKVPATAIIKGVTYKTSVDLEYGDSPGTIRTLSFTKGVLLDEYTSFYGKLDSIDFTGVDATNTTSLYINCSYLKTIKWGDINTKNLERLGIHSEALTSIDISLLNKSKLTYLSFSGCKKAKSIKFGSFTGSNLTSTSDMFSGCSALTSIDLSSWNTSKVESTYGMFSGCSALTSVKLNGWNTSKVTDMSYTFSGCSSLKTLSINHLDVSRVRFMNSMFYGCSALTTLNLSGWNTKNLEELDSMFSGCNSLRALNIQKFNVKYVLNGYNFLGYEWSDRDALKKITIPVTLLKKDYVDLPCKEKDYYDSNGNWHEGSMKYWNTKADGTGQWYKNDHKTGNLSGTYVTLYRRGMVSGQKFWDVPPSHNYYDAIMWASNKGITAGYDDGFFGINDTVTRGQVVMFLWRAAGKPAPKKNTKTFKDVPTNHSYYKAIQWANENGIAAGYTGARFGEFGPSDKCTRGQIVTFMWRYAGQKAPKGTKQQFSDVPRSHNFYKPIQWAYEQKITTGYSDGRFGVNDKCTRGQCVVFIYRVCN